jgi:hypothetical protein
MAGFRTRISCKAEAFAAPWGFLEGGTYWDDWSNALSSRELALAEAHEQLGRPDLKAFVLGSKKYHRLNDILTNPKPERRELFAAQRAFRNEV